MDEAATGLTLPSRAANDVVIANPGAVDRYRNGLSLAEVNRAGKSALPSALVPKLLSIK